MVENRSVSLKSFVRPACLEQVLQARDEGADENPRVGKRTLEPAGLGGAGSDRDVGVQRAAEAAADSFDGAIECLLAGGGRIYIFFETIVHIFSLSFSLLCVNLETNRPMCNPICKPLFTSFWGPRRMSLWIKPLKFE